jgi:hypothetical protein
MAENTSVSARTPEKEHSPQRKGSKRKRNRGRACAMVWFNRCKTLEHNVAQTKIPFIDALKNVDETLRKKWLSDTLQREPWPSQRLFSDVRICVEHTRRDSNILEILPPEQYPLFLAWATMQDPSCPAIHVEHASNTHEFWLVFAVTENCRQMVSCDIFSELLISL